MWQLVQTLPSLPAWVSSWQLTHSRPLTARSTRRPAVGSGGAPSWHFSHAAVA